MELILVVMVALVFGVGGLWQAYKTGPMTPDAHETLLWGARKPALVCPHCQTKGTVRTTPVTTKAGISGGKATAALLTGGVSLLATGLSRKEAKTQAHCDTCDTTWLF